MSSCLVAGGRSIWGDTPTIHVCFAFSGEFDGANIITGFLYFLCPTAIFNLVCLLLKGVGVLFGRGRRFVVEDWHMHTWKFVSRGWGVLGR
jgi:hypothetical protein